MNNKIKNKRWRDESTPFIQPKSHGINPTPPSPTITWNPQPGGKKKSPNFMRSPLIEIIGEAKLHGNGRSQWQQFRRRKRRAIERDKEVQSKWQKKEKRRERERGKEREREVKFLEKKKGKESDRDKGNGRDRKKKKKKKEREERKS